MGCGPKAEARRMPLRDCVVIAGLCLVPFALAPAGVTTAAQAPSKPASSHAAGHAATSSRAVGIEGEWDGALQAGEMQLKLILHLSGEKAGELHAKLDSPEQGVYGLDVSSVVREQNNLRFEIGFLGVWFDGKISTDARTITGAWKQGGSELPLVLHRQSVSASNRPAN